MTPRSETETNILKGLYIQERGRDDFTLINGEVSLNPPGVYRELGQSRLGDDLAGRDPNMADKVFTSNFRGISKLVSGIASLPIATAEVIGFVGEGTTNELGMAFDEALNRLAPAPQGMGYDMVEAFSQYMVPGLGSYKLFGALTKLKGVDRFLRAAFKGQKKINLAKAGMRLFGAEFTTTFAAQNPTDANFVGFIMELFGTNETVAQLMENEIVNAIGSPSKDWEAVSVFKEKLQAVPGDLFVAGGFELLLKFGSAMIKGYRNIKKNSQDIINDVDENELFPQEAIEATANRIPDEEIMVDEPVSPSTNPPAVTTGGLFDLIRNNPDGFSITLNGQTPQELGYDTGYMVAYSKKMEIVSSEKTFTVADTDKLIDNAELLEDLLGGSEGEIYVGGWLYEGSYYLDASVRVDNLDEALYIANSADQLGIFDLKEFNNVETKQGIEELKQSGVYDSSKESFQRRKTQTIDRQIDESRLALSGGNS